VNKGIFHNFYKIYFKLEADFGFTVEPQATYNADDTGSLSTTNHRKQSVEREEET